MFLQIHYLTSYHASLLNRDDAGLAKRIKFGGVERLRVSSQCLKRHWRMWMVDHTDMPRAVRSRHFFSRQVKQRLVANGMDNDLAHELVFHFAKGLLTAAGDKEPLDRETLSMKQPVLFGLPEANFFVRLIEEAAQQGDTTKAKKYLDAQLKECKNNFRVMLRQAGFDDPVAGFEGALFGRFVTSDILSRIDAPVHVAHAITTHALDTEVDFFTVVDDLAEDEETGAAHANDMELGAGLFYGYVVVDIPLLVSNLTGCPRTEWHREDLEETRQLLALLVNAISQVSPGAKLGATAPYARAEFVMLEVGKTQPRSLANAFLTPVRLESTSDPMQASISAIADYLSALEQMYANDGEKRYISTIRSWPRQQEQIMTLPEAIERSLESISGDVS